MSTIEVNNEDGTTKEITARNEIESTCLQENCTKYTQTESTIYMQDPLRTMLGPTGDTQFCAQILDGTATYPVDTPLHTQEFFHQLKRLDNATSQPMELNITARDFKEGWNKMKEKQLQPVKLDCTLDISKLALRMIS